MSARVLSLSHGRSLSVAAAGDDELVEIRDSAGLLELRFKLTDDGVVLQVEAARISLKAAESVDVDCKTFSVNAEVDVRIEARGEVRVQGETIRLN